MIRLIIVLLALIAMAILFGPLLGCRTTRHNPINAGGFKWSPGLDTTFKFPFGDTTFNLPWIESDTICD